MWQAMIPQEVILDKARSAIAVTLFLTANADRTSELRKKGYEGRRLGPVQMTTDTAVRVTRLVIQDQMPLDSIVYIDSPELKINKNESTEMPFRYVRDEQGQPLMPDVSMPQLIKCIVFDSCTGNDRLDQERCRKGARGSSVVGFPPLLSTGNYKDQNPTTTLTFAIAPNLLHCKGEF
jgi:hypothetical protein